MNQQQIIQLNKQFVNDCKKGTVVDIRKYWREYGSEYINLDNGFTWAAVYDNIEVIKYLLTSPELPNNKVANIHAENHYTIRGACTKGNWELAEYLLLSSELKEKANPTMAFLGACHGNLEIMSKLLDLGLIIDYHYNKDEGFKNILAGKHIELVNYLILDRGIPITSEMKDFLEQFNNNSIYQYTKDVFAKRELHDRLQMNLAIKIKANGKNKV